MKIYKFALQITDEQIINIIGLVQILSVKEQRNSIVVYAVVVPDLHNNVILVLVASVFLMTDRTTAA